MLDDPLILSGCPCLYITDNTEVLSFPCTCSLTLGNTHLSPPFFLPEKSYLLQPSRLPLLENNEHHLLMHLLGSHYSSHFPSHLCVFNPLPSALWLLHTYACTLNSLIIWASHSCCKLPCISIICLHDSFQLVWWFLIIVVSQVPLRIWLKQWTFSLETWKRCTYTHTHSQVAHTIPDCSLNPTGVITALLNTSSFTPLPGSWDNYTSLLT